MRGCCFCGGGGVFFFWGGEGGLLLLFFLFFLFFGNIQNMKYYVLERNKERNILFNDILFTVIWRRTYGKEPFRL